MCLERGFLSRAEDGPTFLDQGSLLVAVGCPEVAGRLTGIRPCEADDAWDPARSVVRHDTWERFGVESTSWKVRGVGGLVQAARGPSNLPRPAVERERVDRGGARGSKGEGIGQQADRPASVPKWMRDDAPAVLVIWGFPNREQLAELGDFAPSAESARIRNFWRAASRLPSACPV